MRVISAPIVRWLSFPHQRLRSAASSQPALRFLACGRRWGARCVFPDMRLRAEERIPRRHEPRCAAGSATPRRSTPLPQSVCQGRTRPGGEADRGKLEGGGGAAQSEPSARPPECAIHFETALFIVHIAFPAGLAPLAMMAPSGLLRRCTCGHSVALPARKSDLSLMRCTARVLTALGAVLKRFPKT